MQQTVGDSEIVTPEHINKMSYLRKVVKETQRCMEHDVMNVLLSHALFFLLLFSYVGSIQLLVSTSEYRTKILYLSLIHI